MTANGTMSAQTASQFTTALAAFLGDETANHTG
jgi:hypothetical protein